MLLLVHISPNAIFSQVADTTLTLQEFNWSANPTNINRNAYTTGKAVSMNDFVITPDTIHAIILVTLSPNGPAHARMGYVVRQDGKPVAYLDCRKRALKWPQVGWGYELVNPNAKLK